MSVTERRRLSREMKARWAARRRGGPPQVEPAAPPAGSALAIRLGAMKKTALNAAARARNLWDGRLPGFTLNGYYQELTEPANVEEAVQDLAPDDRGILEFLALVGEATVAEIAAETRAAAETVSSSFGRLDALLFVEIFPAGPSARLYTEYRRSIPFSCYGPLALLRLLGGLEAAALRELCRRFRVKADGGTSALKVLVAQFRRIPALGRSMEALEPEVRAHVEQIARDGGLRNLPSGTKSEEEVVRKLSRCAPLLFILKAHGTRAYQAIVPVEVQRAIRSGFREIPTGTAEVAAFLAPRVPGVHRADRNQGRAEFDVVLVALILARGEVRLTQNRKITVADLKKLQKRLQEGGPGYASFLLGLVGQRGWYQFRGRVSRIAPAFSRDLGAMDLKRWCLQTWIGLEGRMELHGLSGTSDGAGYSGMGTPKPSRQAVLEALLACPGGAWLSLDRLALWIEEHGGAAAPGVEGPAVSEMLDGPLAWIGAVEAGEDLEGRRFIRIPPGGSAAICAALNADEAKAPPQPRGGGPRLVIQPNGEIIALEGLDPELLLKLAAFSEPMVIDGVSTFLLTRRSVEPAVAQGANAADLARFLEEESGRSLPGTVQELFTELGDSTAWELGFAGYILTAPTPEALDALIAVPPPGLGVRRLGLTVAGVEARKTAAGIINALGKTGRRTGAHPALASPYPPHIPWAPIEQHTPRRDLFYRPPVGARTAAASREEILDVIERAWDYGLPVRIQSLADSGAVGETLTLVPDLVDHDRVSGFDRLGRRREIAFDAIDEVFLGDDG